MARAMREARSSAPAQPPNVVAIYDAIDEGDHIWLVMEYVDGRTLSRSSPRTGRSRPERVARSAPRSRTGWRRRTPAARSTATSSRATSWSDRDGLAKISDFGISRTDGDDTLTQTGMLSGTPSYFSPEIARGEDPSPASDAWALGATLFAAVEGRPPYASQPNPLATLANIVGQPPPPRNVQACSPSRSAG